MLLIVSQDKSTINLEIMSYLPIVIALQIFLCNFFAKTKIDCIFALTKSENSSVGRA